MPFHPVDAERWKRKFRRALLVGGPNSWKTTSLQTWPKPLEVVNVPGEQGVASLPVAEGIHAYTWEDDGSLSPQQLWGAFQKQVFTAVGGQKLTTLAIEGGHKLYDLIYDAELEKLTEAFPTKDEEDLRGQAFGRAHTTFTKFIQRVGVSTVPYVVMTCWATEVKDDKKNRNSPVSVWPDFPGQMAQKILGEFGAVLFAIAGREIAPGQGGQPGKFSSGQWQTRSHGPIKGVGLKVPQEVAARIPTYVPQDWQRLEAMVMNAASTNKESK